MDLLRENISLRRTEKAEDVERKEKRMSNAETPFFISQRVTQTGRKCEREGNDHGNSIAAYSALAGAMLGTSGPMPRRVFSRPS